MRLLSLLLFLISNTFFAYSQNLVQCPGAETDPLANGWTAVYSGTNCYNSSNWSIPGLQNSYPAAQEGSRYFFPGCRNGADVVGTFYELYQDIDVQQNSYAIDNNGFQVNFAGYIRTFNSSNYDNSEIIVEYRNQTNSAVLSSYATGNAIPSAWVRYSDSRTAPSGTRFIRVRLVSQYRSGSSIDSYFDNISLTTLTTVPVKLLNFQVRGEAEKAMLSWETTDEVNNKGFNIQRSPDGNDWKTIAFVPASSDAGPVKRYQHEDIQASTTTTFYRLQQLDLDGRFEYSKVVVLKSGITSAINIYPNPATNFIYITSDARPISAEIFSSTGILVRKVNNPQKDGVNISALTPGLYSIKINFTDNSVLKRFVKQ